MKGRKTPRRVFRCRECGAQAAAYEGRCVICGGWATMQESVERPGKDEGSLSPEFQAVVEHLLAAIKVERKRAINTVAYLSGPPPDGLGLSAERLETLVHEVAVRNGEDPLDSPMGYLVTLARKPERKTQVGEINRPEVGTSWAGLETAPSGMTSLKELVAKLPAPEAGDTVEEEIDADDCQACGGAAFVTTRRPAHTERRWVDQEIGPCPDCTRETPEERRARLIGHSGLQGLQLEMTLDRLEEVKGIGPGLAGAKAFLDGEVSHLVLIGGTGRGKLLAVETQIPTPAGWTKLGEMKVGDWVFDETGMARQILAVYEAWPRSAYRLHFSDGTHLDACGDHLWLTTSRRSRKAMGRRRGKGSGRWGNVAVAGPKVRTTTEIVRSLRAKDGHHNHSIAMAQPLRMPDAILPIDPYVLGIWLGDGDSNRAVVTTADDEVVAQIGSAGYGLGSYDDGHERTLRYPVYGLQRNLRAAGLLSHKHIPYAYLRASTEQRLALLQGLMDSDGSAYDSRVEFSTTNEELMKGALELARSLGQKPRVYSGRARLYGRDCGPHWRIVWRPTLSVFRLSRKGARIRPLGRQASRSSHRMIVAAESIPLQPMRCIRVNSPSGLFLAGEAMVPTHNTHLAVGVALACIERGELCLYLNVARFLDDLRACYGSDEAGDAFRDMMQGPLTCDVLVLDDLGGERRTDWAMEKLYEIVDCRYGRGLRIIACSNQSMKSWDPRIVSRLGDRRRGRVVVIEAVDYRLVPVKA